MPEKMNRLPRWRAALFAATATVLAACGQEIEREPASRGAQGAMAEQQAESTRPVQPAAVETEKSSPEAQDKAAADRHALPLESLVKAGRSLGTFIVPRLCNLAIDIVAMPPEQVDRFGEDTVIDALPPDPNPNPGCQEAIDHAAQMRHAGNPKHAARNERTNPAEYKGFANQFVPTAAWDMGSVLPGKPGIAVMPGHRTTHTAPFSELDLVRPGDTAELRLISGETLRYQATYNGVLREKEGSVVIPDEVSFDATASYIVSYACAPQRSSVDRQVTVWVKL